MAQNKRKGTTGKRTGSSSTSNTNRRKKTSGSNSRSASGRSSASGNAGRSSSSRKSSSRSGGARKAAAVQKARMQRQQRDREIRLDIALVVMLLAMAFIYLSLAGYGAAVGRALSMILFGMFGLGAWLVPVWVFVFCLFLITRKGGRQMPVRLIAAALLILVIQAAGHLYLHSSGRISLDVPFDIKAAFDLCSGDHTGGGILGGWFARLLYRAFGVVGSGLVYLGLAVVAVILMIQKSPAGAFRSMRERREEEGIPSFSERREMRRRQREQEREEEEELRELREAERILEREDRAAARARQREEREQNAKNRRRRRNTSGSGGLDLEHMLLDDDAYGRSTKTASKDIKSRSGRRANTITNMDRRKDVHEIHVLTAEDEEPMTVAAVPAASVSPARTGSAGDESMVSVIGSEGPDLYDDTVTAADPAGPAAGTAAADRQVRSRGVGSRSVTAGNDAESLQSTAGGRKGTIRTAVSVIPAAKTVTDPAAAAGTGEPLSAAGRKETVPAASPKTAGQSAAERESANAFNPSEEDLQNITVHREDEQAAGSNAVPSAPVRKASNYVNPTFNLLEQGNTVKNKETERELQNTAYRLQETLRTFGVQVTITDISQGPSVTRYELKPDKGVKVSKIVNLSDDIKLRLAASEIRIEAPIPGKSAIGIEVPNKTRTTLHICDLLASREFRTFKGKIPFAVGKDIVGKNVITDIARMPHLLIAGATGSGKSVCINTIILSILYKCSPDKVQLILIDPKVVELRVYEKIPHLIIPVVTDVRKASAALNWAVTQMERRYNLFAAAGARDLDGYNSMAEEYRREHGEYDREPLPRIVIIVDELADLMMVAKNEVENAICRLAQLARAAGIHLIIATQRPSVDVITGLIKANMPSRIAFSVSSQIDSRTILDMAGAEKLIGQGDMLFYPQNYQKPARIQGAFVSDNEVYKVVKYIKEHNDANGHDEKIAQEIEDIEVNGISSPASKDVKSDPARDEHFADAGRFIIEKNKASIGLLQRVFKIGFNRAARIMDQLAEAGVVSEESSTRARQVLMSMPEFEEYLENNT